MTRTVERIRELITQYDQDPRGAGQPIANLAEELRQQALGPVDRLVHLFYVAVIRIFVLRAIIELDVTEHIPKAGH